MYKVKDYKFETEQEAKDAQSELRAVDYLRTKVNMEQPEAALEIFKQLLDQDIFHTIVGYDFLKSLQNILRSSPAINNADIPQIPDSLAQSVLPKIAKQPAAGRKTEEKKADTGAERKGNAEQPDGVLSETEDNPAEDKEPSGEAKASKQSPKKEKKRREKQPREKRPKEKKEKKPFVLFDRQGAAEDGGRYRALAITFAATSMILLVAVIAMFAITLTSDNPTILDYETKLQNRYSEWEEELAQKESELKNREADIEFREQALRNQTFAPIQEYSQPPQEQPESADTPGQPQDAEMGEPADSPPSEGSAE